MVQITYSKGEGLDTKGEFTSEFVRIDEHGKIKDGVKEPGKVREITSRMPITI